MTEIIHILPENDWMEHVEEGSMCCCKPSVAEAPMIGVLYVVHNSFDGREWKERYTFNPRMN